MWFSPPPNAKPPSPFSSTSTSTCPLHYFRHLHQLPAISADLQTLHSVADKCIANVPEIFRHIIIEDIASCCILCLLQQSLCKTSSCITLTCHLHLIPSQSHKHLLCCPYRFFIYVSLGKLAQNERKHLLGRSSLKTDFAIEKYWKRWSPIFHQVVTRWSGSWF